MEWKELFKTNKEKNDTLENKFNLEEQVIKVRPFQQNMNLKENIDHDIILTYYLKKSAVLTELEVNRLKRYQIYK